MKKLVLTLAFLAFASPAFAQLTVTGAKMELFRVSAPTIVVNTQTYQVSTWQCNQTNPAPVTGPVINPNRLVFDDSNNAGRACIVDVSTFINATVAGDYHVTVKLVYNDGSEGGASNVSNPFTRFIAAVVTGVRLVRF